LYFIFPDIADFEKDLARMLRNPENLLLIFNLDPRWTATLGRNFEPTRHPLPAEMAPQDAPDPSPSSSNPGLLNVTYRSWLATFAPVFIRFSCSIISDRRSRSV
jgi:hypothetical protein